MDSILVELQVKIISKDIIKPSNPTPSHLQTFNLSFLDQLSAPLHIKSLIFYNPTTETRPVDIAGLKLALSQTLTRFYPLAGRCKDENTIICNDEGVPFIEARVGCALSDVLASPKKIELLGKFQFLPPKDILSNGKQPMSELVHLAFQVNVFVCGGVVIGCYMLHKVMDATSLGLFFRHWSALARKISDRVIQPDFESTVAAFPPYHAKQQEQNEPTDQYEKYYAQNADGLKIVGNGFVFSDVAAKKLKENAASERVPNPTRFETVLGFIWEKALAAESTVYEHTNPPALLFVADMRKRIGPPISETSIGNLIATPIAFAETGSGLPELVAEIHAAIIKMRDETVKRFVGEGGVEAILNHKSEFGSYLGGHKASTYMASSWCKSGMSEADFGFGNPSLIMYPVTDGAVTSAYRNFISLTEYSDASGDGIVAWIYLKEKEMQVLQSNEEFLAFATLW